jgi:hypothetical protein
MEAVQILQYMKLAVAVRPAGGKKQSRMPSSIKNVLLIWTARLSRESCSKLRNQELEPCGVVWYYLHLHVIA